MSTAKTRRARVLAAGARSKAHIHICFPCMNASPERSSEFGIEEQGGPHSVVHLDVLDDVADREHVVPANLALYLLPANLSSAVLTYIVDGGMPELINNLPPLMPRAEDRLHLVDPSREVDVKTLDHEVA